MSLAAEGPSLIGVAERPLTAHEPRGAWTMNAMPTLLRGKTRPPVRNAFRFRHAQTAFTADQTGQVNRPLNLHLPTTHGHQDFDPEGPELLNSAEVKTRPRTTKPTQAKGRYPLFSQKPFQSKPTRYALSDPRTRRYSRVPTPPAQQTEGTTKCASHTN